jgi:hypothetical protein
MRRIGFKTPLQASNALVTAKRMFERQLRSVVAEYAGDESEVESELMDLRRIFSDAPEFAGNITAAQFIARIRRPVRRIVAGWTGIYQYTIDRVIEDMMNRSRALRLRLAVPEDQARQEFTVLLTVQAMNYLHSGGHRLFL